jgi:hypothetical protein
MNNEEKKRHFKNRLESFLSRACESETNKDYVTAARLFRLALFCETKVRTDINSTYGYIFQAMPVY